MLTKGRPPASVDCLGDKDGLKCRRFIGPVGRAGKFWIVSQGNKFRCRNKGLNDAAFQPTQRAPALFRGPDRKVAGCLALLAFQESLQPP